jgi:hypothetical protein
MTFGAKLIPNMGQDQQDITCPNDYNFCSTAKWKNASWSNGNHPSLNWNNPPQKDTVIVPTGTGPNKVLLALGRRTDVHREIKPG